MESVEIGVIKGKKGRPTTKKASKIKTETPIDYKSKMLVKNTVTICNTVVMVSGGSGNGNGNGSGSGNVSIGSNENLIMEIPIKNVTTNSNVPTPLNEEKMKDLVETNTTSSLNVLVSNTIISFTDLIMTRKTQESQFKKDIKPIAQLPKNNFIIGQSNFALTTNTTPEYICMKCKDNELINKYKIENTIFQSNKSNIIVNYNNVILCNELYKDQYPVKTDIHCWWCCHPFDGPPIPIPNKLDKATGKWVVYGCFCSFNCAKSYMCNCNGNGNGNGKGCNSIQLLYDLHYRLTGSKIYDIKCAPPKECLAIFGGHMDISEYRSSFFTFQNYEILSYPFIPCIRQYIYSFNSNISNVSNSGNGNVVTTVPQQPLRLQRKKPLPSSGLSGVLQFK